MALKKNKVKFGLNKVHWAKITAWSDDGVPTFATPVRLISIGIAWHMTDGAASCVKTLRKRTAGLS